MNIWKQDTPSAMPVTITPEIAAAMLKTSIGNRRMRPEYVNRLADAMRRGEWRVTSQGIGFDTSGALRDGHHRLSACVLSGATIQTMLILGMPETAYQVIDTGSLRGYADRLNEPVRVAEILSMAGTILWRSRAVTADQIMPLTKTRLYTLAHELIAYCNNGANFFGSAPMRLAACMAVMQGNGQKFVWGQYRALVNLDYDAMTTASQALVRQVQRVHQHRMGTQGSVYRHMVLTRGLRVFDESRAHVLKIQLNETSIETAVESVRETLRNAVAETTQQSSLSF